MSRLLKAVFSVVLQLFLLHSGQAFALENNIRVIDEDFKESRLGRYVYYISDSTNSMNLRDFLKISSSSKLKPNRKEGVFLGYGQNQYWFQFRLFNQSNSSKELFLNIAYPNLDYFTVYKRTDVFGKDSIIQIAEMGDRFRYGNKLVPHRNYVIPINILPGDTTDFIVRIKKQWEPVNFPLILTDEYNLVRRTNNDNLFLGSAGGVYIMFVLTLIILYFFTRNRFFILYITLNILTLLDLLSDTGFGLQYVWAPWPFIQNILPYFIIVGSILIHITFIRLFFRTAIHLTRFNTFLLFMFWMVVGTIVLLTTFAIIYPGSNLPYQIGYNVVNGIYLTYGLIILSLCVVTMIQVRRIEIFWITIVVFIQLTKWSLQIIARGNAFPIFFKKFSIYDLNFFESHIATPHIIISLVLLEVLIVTLILALSFYGFIKDNSSGKYRLMFLGRNAINAYIDGQENERSRLTQKINQGIGEDIRMLKLQMLEAIKKIDNPVAKAKLLALSEEVQKVGESVKKITTDFVPSEYADKSFYDSIKQVFNVLAQKNIQVRFQLQEPSPRVNNFSKLNLIRILQELAGNIHKHSNAQNVLVKANLHQDLHIFIQDDGDGFDRQNMKGGIGLMNIESRVRGLGGEMEVESAIGKGTAIRIKIPLKNLK